jgi:hypothetical protein
MSLIKSLEGKVFILEKFSIFIKYPKGRELKGGENMKNKKGLSTIVTTLIIILLVLVAIGIIWSVVKGLLDDSKDDISNSQKCLDIEIEVSKLNTTNATAATGLTLKRTSTGMEDPVGAKVVFYSADGNTQPLYFGGSTDPKLLERFETATEGFDLISEGSIANDEITQIELIPFFYDESGAEVLCQTQTVKEL